MSVQVLVTCDAVHEGRTPKRCRAFMAVPPGAEVAVYVTGAGWTLAGAGREVRTVCPSCSRPSG